MKSLWHYLFSFSVLGIYGGQVCPYIDSLDTASWLFLLLVIFGVMYAVRRALYDRFVTSVSDIRRPFRCFEFEFAFYLAGGIVVTLFDFVAFSFPFGSGIKILVGFLGLGFFASADVAMEMERDIAGEAGRGQTHPPEGRYLSVTLRFVFVATVAMVFTVVVIFLVIIRDMAWLTQVNREGMMNAMMAVMAELLFISLVVLAELLNLIRSFSINLELFLGNENGALVAVAGGDMNVNVPVGTNDEFGVMAAYTNNMIEKLRQRTQELILTRDVTINSMTTLAETRDNETGNHILRTQRYVRALAQNLRNHPDYAGFLESDTIDLLYKSAPLHDIGKVGIPDRILLKPGRHTEEEFEIMKKHAQYGKEAIEKSEALLGSNSFLRYAKEIAYSHHEKWDGTGYPQGIKGVNIPLSARLMAVADVYDALISKRVYKPAFTHEKARKIILEEKGSHFDPAVVDSFLAVEKEFIEIAEKYGDHAADHLQFVPSKIE